MQFLPNTFTFSIILFTFIPSLSFGQSLNQQTYASLELSKEATIKDTLSQYAQQANTLWDKKESNLPFVTDFLSIVSRTNAERYYKQASIYYFWSLKNADFKTGYVAIKAEFSRLLPLLSNSTQEHWKRIEYARSKFNENNDSVYGTDERGTFYVRLGAPNKKIKTKMDFSSVYDPELEVWNYQINGDNYVYLFGKDGGFGITV